MALLENVIGYGLSSDRPDAGAPGTIYCSSDTGHVERDNGTTWDLIAYTSPPVTANALTVLPITDDTSLGGANVLCRIDVADKTITLPDPTITIGQLVAVVTDGNAFSVKQHDGVTDAPNSGFSPALYVSDGVTWWTLHGIWA